MGRLLPAFVSFCRFLSVFVGSLRVFLGASQVAAVSGPNYSYNTCYINGRKGVLVGAKGARAEKCGGPGLEATQVVEG